MIQVRRSEDRGHADHGWLKSKHTFSFADYYDPKFMGLSVLRVINEDRVAPGKGFGTHPHRDMEIISYVLEGAIEHRDSMGTGEVLRPGEVQRMTAGTGVAHSEFNPSKADPLHFLQIWIQPEQRGLAPSYEQKNFPMETRRNQLKLVAARDGRGGALTVHQDLSLYATLLDASQSVRLALAAGRKAWVQIARGEASLNGEKLRTGDGAAVVDVEALTIEGLAPSSELLIFDLP